MFMDPLKIGNFIKELRTENNKSQEELAKLLFIDRSVISKWESGKRTPDLKYLVKICEMFNVSLDELVYGERNNQNNQREVKNNFLNYLVSQNAKYRRTKIATLFLSLAVILIGISFLIYYFSETYNKTQVYKVYGNSDSYSIYDGILITTREKSYLKIGQVIDRFNDEQNITDNIRLIYKNKDKEIQIYEGPSDRILLDFYGYDSIINAKNIDDLSNNLYIKINDEIIKLSFKNNFTNDDLMFNDKDGDLEDYNDNNNEIPKRIKEEFSLDGDIYMKTNENEILSFSNFTFYIVNRNNNISVTYLLTSRDFIYDDDRNGNNFAVNSNNEITCMSDSCHDEESLYEEYYNKYIKEYIYG